MKIWCFFKKDIDCKSCVLYIVSKTISSVKQQHIVSCLCKAKQSQSNLYTLTDAPSSTIIKPPSHSSWPASYPAKKWNIFERYV